MDGLAQRRVLEKGGLEFYPVQLDRVPEKGVKVTERVRLSLR